MTDRSAGWARFWYSALLVRTGLVVGLAVSLAACSAGRIAPMFDAPGKVDVGLSDAQIELRAAAEMLDRLPWSDQVAPAESFTLISVFNVLRDGLASEPASGPDGEDADPAPSPAARAYLATLRTQGRTQAERLRLVESQIDRRASATNRFLTAASQVVAFHGTAGGLGSSESADRHLREDRALIVAMVDKVLDQIPVFAETASVLVQRAGAAQAVNPAAGALERWRQEAEALERLQKSAVQVRLM